MENITCLAFVMGGEVVKRIKFQKKHLFWVLVLGWILSGCTAQGRGTYLREQPPGQEHSLRWFYQDGLAVQKGNKLFTPETFWEGLDKAVACVPEAKGFAQKAMDRAKTGRRWKVMGTVTSVTSALVFSVIVALPNKKTGSYIAAISSGGVALGMGMAALLGLHVENQSQLALMDAFDAYNEQAKRQGKCSKRYQPKVQKTRHTGGSQ